MVGIYKIKNKINNKVYIGQSVNIRQRWRNHRTIGKRKNPQLLLYRAMQKYGIENFDFEIVEECLKEDLDEKEIYWINFYDSTNKELGYNLTNGGMGGTHVEKILNAEEVNKIKELLLATSLLQTQIAKLYGVSQQLISDINNGLSWYVKNTSYPIRPRYNSTCKNCGVKVSTGKNICFSCYQLAREEKAMSRRPEPLELARLVKEKGFEGVGRIYNVTGSAIKKWCKDYDIPHLKVDLIKWYDNQTGFVEPIKKKVRKIKQIDIKTNQTINIYDNGAAAARSLGKKKGNHITEVCNGNSKTAYGFKWEYCDT